MTFKKIHVYDCDGVLVDTSHRYRNLPDGSIDMQHWIDNHTAENIAKDRLLPLAKQFTKDVLNPEIYTVLCTVRAPHVLDIQFIVGYLGVPDNLMMLGQAHNATKFTVDHVLKRRALQRLFNLKQFKILPRFFWEDNAKNIAACRDLFTKCFLINSEICK